MTLRLEKYSLGVGDRFAHQAVAQLRACQLAAEQGVDVIPVWNKSHREHITIGSRPESVRQAADDAVKQLQWSSPYYVDADHINLDIVRDFLATSDFFTIDVANAIGSSPNDADLESFVKRHPELQGEIEIPGIDRPFVISANDVVASGRKFLKAVQQAGNIFRHIENQKGVGQFITEVSMDETDSPQTPLELLVILAATADQQIPVQTIAPKFTGRFNKGVDYVGDVSQFEQEFNDDLCVIAHAIEQYGMPDNLKLSVHSGSDKFSIYGPIRRAGARHGGGLHLKTAGTTWLEELIGLAETGGEGLELAQEIYALALENLNALCEPYISVIDIDPKQLPSVDQVRRWSADEYVSALRHDPNCSQYNQHVRQLLHVGYKIAAKMGDKYLDMLRSCEQAIAKNVTENLYDRHLKPVFIDAV